MLANDRSAMLEEYGDSRRRILSGLRFFSNGVTAEELFDALGVPRVDIDRARYAQEIHRLASRREIIRMGERKPFLYKLPPRGVPRSQLIGEAFAQRRQARAELQAERDADRRAREVRLSKPAHQRTFVDTEEFRQLVLRAVGRVPAWPHQIAERIAPELGEPTDRFTAARRRLERALVYWGGRGEVVKTPDGYRRPIRSML